MATGSKYDDTQPTPHSILSRHYGTHSANRVTDREEFNRDGEYMVKQKDIYYDALAISLTEPTDQNALEVVLIMRFLKKEKDRLQKKHWPKSQQQTTTT